MMSEKYIVKGSGEFDIGIPGVWSFPNYGTALTQFALYTFVKSYGLKVLMIERPMCAEKSPTGKLDMFEIIPYDLKDIAPIYPNLKSMYRLNDLCKMFLIGSDQMFNNYLYNAFGRFIVLDWVRSNKRKVGYACSFGFDYIFGSEFDRAEMQRCIKHFYAVSVREKSGIQLMKDEFDLDVQCVLDPVFMCDRKVFIEMGERTQNHSEWDDKKYIFAYIIDPDDKKENLLKKLSIKYAMPVCAVSDAEYDVDTVLSKWSFPTLKKISVECWIKLIRNAEYIVTDSFHGTAFSLIFHKQFVSISNEKRGRTRFVSILGMVELLDRLVEEDLESIANLLEKRIDYLKVEKNLDEKRKFSEKWFEKNIFENQSKLPISDYDAINVRCDWVEDDMIRRINEVKQEQEKLEERINEKYEELMSELRQIKKMNIKIDDGNGVI